MVQNNFVKNNFQLKMKSRIKFSSIISKINPVQMIYIF